ncbi:unnamed protein product [Schistosoma margrebowiei]|uniref:Uncharacterized protein n=1 Tax=Schistosoma margrebowiei TaxID=48269 RepID=A0A3P8CWA6_9TREM|nr:unnamed protein product [Schistosoma margrebowiei]
MFPQDTGAHVHHQFGIRLKRRTFASSSHFRKQHPRQEKAVSRTSLAEAIYAWPRENISRGRADSPHSRPYQGIWGLIGGMVIQVVTRNKS